MSQFRTTADLVDSVLRRCGELIQAQGTSPYLQQAIDYLNQIHHTVIAGGAEFNVDIDEPWIWARARRPLLLELQPPYTTGSVSLTQDSTTGTLSVAPTVSLEGWFLKLNDSPDLFKIGTHSANSTAFTLDGAFTGATNASAVFTIMKLDYDAVSDYIVIDSQNDKLDFSIDGAATVTATITHGTYTPAALATEVAADLHTADSARVYTGSYDTSTRKFSITSDRATSAQFCIFGAGTNYYRSGWNTLGFDFANTTNAATQVGAYAHSTIVRFTAPGRIYWGYSDGKIEGIDATAFDRDFPLNSVSQRVPSHFCVVRQKNDGTMVLRFNAYPDRKMRVEFEYVPVPKDLQNNVASIPLVPRQFSRILEYGAAAYLLTDKEDSKADSYFNIAKATLQGMMRANRTELEKMGMHFGQVIARPDLLPENNVRRRLGPYGYGYDKGVY